MKTTLLLTGGSGFIGRNLQEGLSRWYTVLAPTRRDMDLLDAASVETYIKTHPADVLIHSATTPGHRNAKPAPVLEYDLRMFFNLMNHVGRFGKIIHLGSGSEYDMRHYQSQMSESYFGQHVPADAAGFSKYVASRFLENHPSAIHLRLFGVFGKYEDYEIRFISNAICKTLLNRPITLKQNRRFDYLYVDDLAAILRAFIEKTPNENVYNVTSGVPVELKTVAETVRKIAGKPELPINIAIPGMGLEYSGDNNRLKRDFPGIVFTPLPTAIQTLFDWYSQNASQIRAEALLTDK